MKLSLALVLVATLGATATPTPSLDFLSPFLGKKVDIGGDVSGAGSAGLGGGGAGAGGGLAASGHVDAGLGNAVGFEADGSIAGAKSIGVDSNFGDAGVGGGFGIDKSVSFGVNKQIGSFPDEPVPQPRIIPIRPQPIPQRPLPPPPPPVREPCDHPLPRPLHQRPQPPPPGYREGPYFQKHYRSLDANQEETNAINQTENKMNSSRIIKNVGNHGGQGQEDFDIEPVDVDHDGDIDQDDEDFLRMARSLLDKAILKKANSTKKTEAKNDTHKDEKDKVKRSTPVLVVEDVKFIPLYQVNGTNSSSSLERRSTHHHKTNATNSSEEEDDDSDDKDDDSKKQKSSRSIPSSSLTKVNATTASNGTGKANATEGEDRVVSPKMKGVAHMFHNLF